MTVCYNSGGGAWGGDTGWILGMTGVNLQA